MNIPTPRTDANESITCKEGDPCIAPDFARQLERELTQTKKLLADANKGAKINSHINQSFAGQLNQLKKENEWLREALGVILAAIPAYNEGEFVELHYDGDGNELGFERIDPTSVIQLIQEIAKNALDETPKII